MRISDWSSDVCSSDLVGGAIGVPLDVDVACPEADVLHLGVGLEPVDALAVLAPEGVGVGDRLLVELEIGRFVTPGARCRLGGNRKYRTVRHGSTALPRDRKRVV